MNELVGGRIVWWVKNVFYRRRIVKIKVVRT